MLRPKSLGEAIGSLCLVAVVVLIDDAAWFAPQTRSKPLSLGWEIAIWTVAVTATITILWLAYENWRHGL